MVYIIDRNGKPLMPTKRHGKVKWLLRRKQAKVVKRFPFTIQILYKPQTHYCTQPVTLGVDAGSKHVGLSASTKTEDLFSAEMALRDDSPQLMTARREARHTRRSRLRHRPARFDNRKRPKCWLTPTMEMKVSSHENVINDVCSILPVSRIVIETASFDIQKIRNPRIEGIQYQQGEQLGYENVKAYVKARDGFKCWNCGAREQLEVHHIIQRKDGGSDRPDNLVTLCHDCHIHHHDGTRVLNIPAPRSRGFRAASEMSTMRWFLLDRVRKAHPDIPVEQTYGYITNHVRNSHGLEKSHSNDAFCIAGNLDAFRCEDIYSIRRIRSHNRQVMKLNIKKGGKLKRNQAPRMVMGIARFDMVRHEDGRQMIVTARKIRGLFSLKPHDGSKTLTDVPRKRFDLLWHSNGEIITRRSAFPTSGQA